MAYFDKYGVEFSDNKKILIRCPEDIKGEYLIPDSVTNIGERAFYNCHFLTSITIPEGVISIGDSAFCICSSLKSVTIPNSVTIIGWKAFYGCCDLISVIMPNNIKNIGRETFSGCRSLKSVVIPDSVTNIGDEAFYNCLHMTTITIGNSVTNIGNYVFLNCCHLTSLTMGNRVAKIGKFAFYLCRRLTSVNISDIASWCKIEFDSEIANPLFYAKQLYINGELIDKLIIPNNVTNIRKYAFINCCNLTSVVFPNSVKSIENFAFEGCKNLQKIIVPEGQKERFARMYSMEGHECLLVENENILSEQDSIKNVLRQNNITFFYHFTSRKNIASIKKYKGLYSWQYLKKHEINIPVQGGGELSQDLDRFNGVADYVHLSFCESHPMAYHHKQAGEDMVVLKISTQVALLDDTKFSNMNAVDSKCQCEQGLKGLKLVNFDATKEKYLTNDDPLFKFKQAEILVKTHVPLEYILNIDEF